jgi:hypothetical protein
MIGMLELGPAIVDWQLLVLVAIDFVKDSFFVTSTLDLQIWCVEFKLMQEQG